MDTTISPFALLMKLAGLSRQRLQELAPNEEGRPLSRTAAMYCEAGLYEKNPPRAVSALMTELAAADVDWRAVLLEQYGTENLDQATINWQRAVRAEQQFRVRAGYDDWIDNPLLRDDLSPFEDLAIRTAEKLDVFCKLLKIQTGPVNIFQTQPGRTMPAAIRRALLDAGLSEGQVLAVEKEQLRWANKAPVSA